MHNITSNATRVLGRLTFRFSISGGKKPKSNILSTFRAKLPIVRRNRGTEQEEPEQVAIYRKTASTASTMEPVGKSTPDDPNVATELSPLTGESNEEKETAFDDVKLLITNQSEDDLKKFKEQTDQTDQTPKLEEGILNETPDIVVHSDSKETVAKTDESENA